MNIEKFQERFEGRELWKSINRTLFVGIYSILIFGGMLFPKYMGSVLLGLGIIVPSYISFFINHLREMEKREKGNEVIGGWIEHAHGVGEKYHFYPKDIQPVSKLSESDWIKVAEYIQTIAEMAKEQIKVPVGDKEPEKPQKQLTFQETIDKEKKEMEEIDKEYEIWKKERDESKGEIETEQPIEESGENNDNILEKQYEDETGKNAVWKGKTTKGYLEWKKLKLEKGVAK